jgi:hypothetical protein
MSNAMCILASYTLISKSFLLWLDFVILADSVGDIRSVSNLRIRSTLHDLSYTFFPYPKPSNQDTKHDKGPSRVLVSGLKWMYSTSLWQVLERGVGSFSADGKKRISLHVRHIWQFDKIIRERIATRVCIFFSDDVRKFAIVCLL